jgi:hypothetical protein
MRRIIIAVAATFIAAPLLAGPISPGLWETTTRMTMVSMPNMPLQALAAMKKPHTVRYCVTAAEAAAGPQAAMKNSECKIEKYKMGAGTFEMAMTCQGMRMQSRGTFTPTSYSGRSEMIGGASAGGMHVVSEATGKLVGPCKK